MRHTVCPRSLDPFYMLRYQIRLLGHTVSIFNAHSSKSTYKRLNSEYNNDVDPKCANFIGYIYPHQKVFSIHDKNSYVSENCVYLWFQFSLCCDILFEILVFSLVADQTPTW